MLKTKCVGRLLDLFLNNDPNMVKNFAQLNEKFRNTSLEQIPLFIIDKELYMH